jgi:hypothetical protein
MGFNPRQIVRIGRRLYERRRAEFEGHNPGKYVLIDIRTEKIYVAETPEAAYRQATAEPGDGPYYLVRVGERAAFRSRRLPHGDTAPGRSIAATRPSSRSPYLRPPDRPDSSTPSSTPGSPAFCSCQVVLLGTSPSYPEPRRKLSTPTGGSTLFRWPGPESVSRRTLRKGWFTSSAEATRLAEDSRPVDCRRPGSSRRLSRRPLTLLPAISANRHSALINRICSIVLARDSSRRGLATMQARHIAPETATLRRSDRHTFLEGGLADLVGHGDLEARGSADHPDGVGAWAMGCAICSIRGCGGRRRASIRHKGKRPRTDLLGSAPKRVPLLDAAPHVLPRVLGRAAHRT